MLENFFVLGGVGFSASTPRSRRRSGWTRHRFTLSDAFLSFRMPRDKKGLTVELPTATFWQFFDITKALRSRLHRQLFLW